MVAGQYHYRLGRGGGGSGSGGGGGCRHSLHTSDVRFPVAYSRWNLIVYVKTYFSAWARECIN